MSFSGTMSTSLHFQHFPVREGRPDQPDRISVSTPSHKQERNQPRSLKIDALRNIIEKKNTFKKRKTADKEALHTGIVLIGKSMDSLNHNFDEKKIESRSDYKKFNIKRRRQKVFKKPLQAASSFRKILKLRNATLVENKDNLDHHDAPIEIETSDDVRKGTELFQPSQQEKVEMETVQRKDEQVFFNFFQGFPDTLEDTKIGAKPYFSYIVML
jgi:uncharacterized protein YutE (UPF0331/DUF86 family)